MTGRNSWSSSAIHSQGKFISTWANIWASQIAGRFVIPIYTCIFAPRSRVVVYSNVLRRRGRQGLLWNRAKYELNHIPRFLVPLSSNDPPMANLLIHIPPIVLLAEIHPKKVQRPHQCFFFCFLPATSKSEIRCILWNFFERSSYFLFSYVFVFDLRTILLKKLP